MVVGANIFEVFLPVRMVVGANILEVLVAVRTVVGANIFEVFLAEDPFFPAHIVVNTIYPARLDFLSIPASKFATVRLMAGDRGGARSTFLFCELER